MSEYDHHYIAHDVIRVDIEGLETKLSNARSQLRTISDDLIPMLEFMPSDRSEDIEAAANELIAKSVEIREIALKINDAQFELEAIRR